MSSAKFFKKVKSMVVVTSCSSVIFGGLCYYRNDESFFDKVLMPVTRKLFEPETAHKIAIFTCKWGLLPNNSYKDPETLVKNSFQCFVFNIVIL